MKIEIEESQKFVDAGILVLSQGKRKYYMKPRATNNPAYPIELVPLTSEEKKQFGIIEESEQQSEDSEITIEESLPEDRVPQMSEEEKEAWRKEEEKKSKLTLSGDAETVRKARSILEAEMNKRKSEKELSEENEDLKTKLGIVAEKNLADKKRQLGLDPNNSMTAEQVLGYEKGLESKGKSPEGSAPLNDAQYGQSQNSEIAKRKFASHSELVKFLKMNESDPEARKYLEALWRTTIQAMKSGQKIEYNPQSDLKNESSQPIELRLTGKEQNDPNSELQQFLERGNKRYREQKKLESERFFAEQKKAFELRQKQKESE